MKVMQAGIAAVRIFQTLLAPRKLFQSLLIGQIAPTNQESDAESLDRSITAGSI
jgi:hypothetical protein